MDKIFNFYLTSLGKIKQFRLIYKAFTKVRNTFITLKTATDI